MCFPAAWNPRLKPAGTEWSGVRPVNAMHAGSQVESRACIIMCHETPYHQIQIHHIDFWIMLLRNSELIRRLCLRFGSSDPEVEPWTA